MPHYILLLHDSGTFPPDLSPEAIQGIIKRYSDWRARVGSQGRLVQGHKLRDGEGRLLRGKVGSPTVTDGPYAEAKEIIGGLFIIEAKDYDEAARIASDCPHLEFGTIEIREIQPTPGRS
jgi:hypothetical protein